MKPVTIIVPANATITLAVRGQFIKVRSGAAELSYADRAGNVAVLSSGRWQRFPEPFDRLDVTNATGASVTHVALVGLGEAGDDNVSGQVTVEPADTVTDAADVAAGATATTLVLAANANRKEAWIANLSASVTLRWGSSNAGAARGIPVPPESTVIIGGPTGYTGAVYVYNPDAAAVSVARLELEKP